MIPGTDVQLVSVAMFHSVSQMIGEAYHLQPCAMIPGTEVQLVYVVKGSEIEIAIGDACAGRSLYPEGWLPGYGQLTANSR